MIDFRVLQKVTWIVYTLDYISQRLSFWPKLMAGHVGAGHVRPNVTQKGGRGVGGDRGQFILAILPIMNCRCAGYNESRLLLF